MITSMTGYGRGKYQVEGREYTVEIKSVNHRYCDINLKLPRAISYLEDKTKKEIQQTVARGKIDVFVTFNNNSKEGQNVNLNLDIAKMYIEQLEKLAEATNIRNDISVMSVSKFPDVLEIRDDENEEQLWNELLIAIKEAEKQFSLMRQKEGEKLSQDLLIRLEEIDKKVDQISESSTGLIEQYVVKLEERIKDLLKTEVDQTRLAQEVVIYSDKCSVEEEITRLKSHISQLRNLLQSNKDEAVGKRLDFLVQEMNRETNTIGSKANCLDITNLVVDVKTQLENIREQIQNIE